MKFKGEYSASTAYSVGDAVKGADNQWYVCIAPGAAAGTSVFDTDYFNKIADPVLRDVLSMLEDFELST